MVLAQSAASTGGALNSKRGAQTKNSFNSSSRSNNQAPKLDSLKLGVSDSAKTTPRLQAQQ